MSDGRLPAPPRAALLLLACLPVASAYVSSQDALIPSTVVFLDLGCARDGNLNLVPDNAPGCLDDLDGFPTCVATDNGNDCDPADGTADATLRVQRIFGTGTTVTVEVGSDRDDDGVTSTNDVGGSSDASSEVDGSACNDAPATPGCYDDDVATFTGTLGPSHAIQWGICFSRDRAAAGGDWDRLAVTVTPGTAGDLVRVTLDATSGAACPLWPRLGHADDHYHS